MTSLSNRSTWMLFAGLACLLAAGTAAAQSNPTSCTNDIDCVATPSCGGDICDWATQLGQMKCHPAGAYPAGQDGWCTHDSDCKCKDLGATCVGVYCSFTRPCDAPGAGGCTTGTGGSGTGTGGSSSTGTGGSSGTAGTSGGSSGGGGCSVAPTGATEASILLAALGLLALPRRRRR
jgi:MYXO-CTERM domain-containing protein